MRVSDDPALSLTKIGGILADLVAQQWSSGADDRMGKPGHPLTGATARVHDLLTTAEEERSERAR